MPGAAEYADNGAEYADNGAPVQVITAGAPVSSDRLALLYLWFRTECHIGWTRRGEGTPPPPLQWPSPEEVSRWLSSHDDISAAIDGVDVSAIGGYGPAMRALIGRDICIDIERRFVVGSAGFLFQLPSDRCELDHSNGDGCVVSGWPDGGYTCRGYCTEESWTADELKAMTREKFDEDIGKLFLTPFEVYPDCDDQPAHDGFGFSLPTTKDTLVDGQGGMSGPSHFVMKGAGLGVRDGFQSIAKASRSGCNHPLMELSSTTGLSASQW